MDYPITCQEGQLASIKHHLIVPLAPLENAPPFFVSWSVHVSQTD